MTLLNIINTRDDIDLLITSTNSPLTLLPFDMDSLKFGPQRIYIPNILT